MRPYLLATLLTLTVALGEATAQCQTSYAPVVPAPTVAYSPVVAAPAPVVVQTNQYNGWYPGKYLINFFRGPRTTTTYTSGYAPAAATPYTAGYAPTYTVGYATTPAGGFRTAYRPTYPITYGPVVQTVSRPVVLSPVMPACNACGVTQSSYSTPLGGSCSSCQSSPATYYEPARGSSTMVEPRPELGPQDNPPLDRSLLETQKPESDDAFNDTFEDDTFDLEIDREPTSADESSATGDYWGAPPLFAPSKRVTSRPHPAPVQTAVYRRQADARRTAFTPSETRGKQTHLSADGWVSAER